MAAPKGTNCEWVQIPVEPLLEYLTIAFNSRVKQGIDIGARCDALGITKSSWHNMIARKTINWIRADKLAVALGLHPALIWNDWYELTDMEAIKQRRNDLKERCSIDNCERPEHALEVCSYHYQKLVRKRKKEQREKNAIKT
jgi:lambda repressor-like predicted transcriptional regulator